MARYRQLERIWMGSRSVLLVGGFCLIDAFAVGLIIPLYPLLKKVCGWSPSTYGIIMSMFGLGQLLGTTYLKRLVDGPPPSFPLFRPFYGLRGVMFLSYSGSVIAYFLLYTAMMLTDDHAADSPAPPSLATAAMLFVGACRFIAGFARHTQLAASLAIGQITGDLPTTEPNSTASTVRGIGVVHLAFSTGLILGPLFTGFACACPTSAALIAMALLALDSAILPPLWPLPAPPICGPTHGPAGVGAYDADAAADDFDEASLPLVGHVVEVDAIMTPAATACAHTPVTFASRTPTSPTGPPTDAATVVHPSSSSSAAATARPHPRSYSSQRAPHSSSHPAWQQGPHPRSPSPERSPSSDILRSAWEPLEPVDTARVAEPGGPIDALLDGSVGGGPSGGGGGLLARIAAALAACGVRWYPRGVTKLLCITAYHVITMQCIVTVVPLHVLALGGSAAAVALILSIDAAAGAVAGFGAPLVARLQHRTRYLVTLSGLGTALMLLGLAASVTELTQRAPLVVACMGLLGLCRRSDVAVVSAKGTVAVGDAMRVFSLVEAISAIVGPVLGGFLYAYAGGSVFYVMSIVAFVAAGMTLLFDFNFHG